MKKIIFSAFAAALMLCSCSTTRQTATEQQINSQITSTGVHAKLVVSPKKIVHTYYPESEVRRGGLQNCINAAIHEALEKNGGGDVLVQTEKTITTYKGLFRKSVKKITVTGYPATYTEFHSGD